MHSQFGKIFQLPVARCCNSANLVHALLSHQLVTTKKHEIWFIFGGQPLRYSIREFTDITNVEEEDVGKTGMWKSLFGRTTAMNVSPVLMLKDPELPQWKRLPLALIVLVDGVLFCNSKNLALTEKYVVMLSDLESFMQEHPLTRLRRQLKQQTSACYGFPLSLQLMAFQFIPMLVSKIPQPDNLKTIVDDPEGFQNVVTLLHLEDILAVVSDALLSVKPMVVEDDQQNELRWDDE
ncbi:hypothetical protein EUTSA_v10002942mg, partial [Eutrema salsugineum]